MRLTCPHCLAEFGLEIAVDREADGRAFGELLDRVVPALRGQLVPYLAMFRPAKRRLSIARAAALLTDLLPDIERGAIARKGRDWPAGPDTWRAGLEHMQAMHAKGGLTLPLSGHGYLYEVLCGLSDKREAAEESEREQQRRGRAHEAGPQAVVNVLPQLETASPEVVAGARERLAAVRAGLAAMPRRPKPADLGESREQD